MTAATGLEIKRLADGNFEVSITDECVTQLFAKLFHDSHSSTTWGANKWLDRFLAKCPLDCWIYQEIIAETRPDVIIETGTALGGSALFYASVCDMLQHGRVVSIDITKEADLAAEWQQEPGYTLPRHPRIRYLFGSSIAENIMSQVSYLVRPQNTVMVILDSDHAAEHVARELALYSDLVTTGNYLIVEDTNLSDDAQGGSPRMAVEAFLVNDDRFKVDTYCERFLLTFNPGGYLRRVK